MRFFILFIGVVVSLACLSLAWSIVAAPEPSGGCTLGICF